MASESVSIQNGRLLLEGQPLTLEKNTHHDLEHVLGSLGRAAIIDTIETMYRETQEKNPGATVQRPSLVAMDLGNQDALLSSLGRMNRTRLHRSIVEVGKPVLQPWHTIRSFGFTPEIRSGLGSRQNPQNQLLFRNPETDPAPATPLAHLPEALGFVEPGEIRYLRPMLRQAHADNDTETYRRLWNQVADENEAASDRQLESFGRDAEALARVGQFIAETNLRVEILGDEYLLDPDRYEQALADIRDQIVFELSYEKYPFHTELNDVESEITREIARVRSLR